MMAVYAGAVLIRAATFLAITIAATTFVAAAITFRGKCRTLDKAEKGGPDDKQAIKKFLHEMLPIKLQFFKRTNHS